MGKKFPQRLVSPTDRLKYLLSRWTIDVVAGLLHSIVEQSVAAEEQGYRNCHGTLGGNERRPRKRRPSPYQRTNQQLHDENHCLRKLFNRIATRWRSRRRWEGNRISWRGKRKSLFNGSAIQADEQIDLGASSQRQLVNQSIRQFAPNLFNRVIHRWQ